MNARSIQTTATFTGAAAGVLAIVALLWSITLNRDERHHAVRSFLAAHDFTGKTLLVDVAPCGWDNLIGVRFYVTGNVGHQGTLCWDRSKDSWRVVDLKPF